MNELMQLLGLVEEGKKEEAQKLVDAVKVFINGLDTKIVDFEKLKNDAIASRDEAKAKLKSIAQGLGADVENVAEAIDAIKNKKAGNDDVKDREIEALKLEISQLKDENTNISTQSQEQLKKMALKTDIAKMLPIYKVKTGAIDHVTSAVEKLAHYEDGKIVFKNEDGTTKRIDGEDATVEAIIKEMQKKEVDANESMFFNIEVQASGAGGAGGKKTQGDFVP